MNSGIVSRIPGLDKLLRKLVKKFLDFSAIPFIQSDLQILFFERDLSNLNLSQLSILESQLIEFLELISSNFADGIELTRVGSINDGGYFLPSSHLTNLDWVTFGLGNNTEFENDLIELGCRVVSYDHSISKLPKSACREIEWFRLGISNLQQPNFITLEKALTKSRIQANWGLKSDIEGMEWKLFEPLSQVDNPPLIMIFEIHNLFDKALHGTLSKEISGLRKLISNYEVFFIQGNNFTPRFSSSRILINDAIEICFLLKGINIVKEPGRKLGENAFESVAQLATANDPRRVASPIYFRR
jgi:hypothetical protein